MVDHYTINCSCGFNDAKAKYYEKDSVYSSRAIWTFSNLKCDREQVEKPSYMSIEDALSQAKPSCPDCDAAIIKEQLISI